MIARAFAVAGTTASTWVDLPNSHLQCFRPLDAEACPPGGNNTYCLKEHYEQKVKQDVHVQANEWHHDDHYGYHGQGNGTVWESVIPGIKGNTTTFCEHVRAVVYADEEDSPVKGPITQKFVNSGVAFTYASNNTRAVKQDLEGHVEFNQTASVFESRSTVDTNLTYVVMNVAHNPVDPTAPLSLRSRGAGQAYVTMYYKDDGTELDVGVESIFHHVQTWNQTVQPDGTIKQSIEQTIAISGTLDDNDIFVDETMHQVVSQVVTVDTGAPEVATARPPAFPVELVSNTLLHKVAASKNIALRLPSRTRESAPESILV